MNAKNIIIKKNKHEINFSGAPEMELLSHNIR